MLTVAVTGGIGSGKSTVAAVLAELGAAVIDSDVLARAVVAPGTAGLAAVVAEFGRSVLSAGGELDRAALATIVFADPGARSRLEAITHPLVRAEFRRLRADAAARDPGVIVVNDIPILRTRAAAAEFDLVVVVVAAEAVRVERLVGRGLGEADARARIAAQITDDERRPLADVAVENDGGEAELRDRVRRLWTERLVPFAANIAAGRRAPRPAPALADPDPRWAVQAALLAARVSLAAGGGRCDHIGSTAVPGLPAKDVIDLQLAVPSLARADEIAPALAAAGFPRVDRVDRDVRHGDGAAGDGVGGDGVGGDGVGGDVPHGDCAGGDGGAHDSWSKRFHANADPGRAVNLHVRVAGAPNWRWAMLFRDWLRAEPVERDAYVDVKRVAAAAHDDIAGYADAKEEWLTAAAERMERWAASTGWVPDGAGT